MAEAFRNHSAKAAIRRKRLREEMSISEQVFWEAIRKQKLGFQFKRQVSVGPYFLDFYCPRAQLDIELDGEQHQQRLDHDKKRDSFLADCGIEVMRIPTLELFDETGSLMARWLERIAQKCEDRIASLRGSGHPSLPNPSPPDGGKGA